MPYKGALETWYVENQGLVTDLKILTGTAIAVLRPGWTGYARWFRDLPKPESAIVQEFVAA